MEQRVLMDVGAGARLSLLHLLSETLFPPHKMAAEHQHGSETRGVNDSTHSFCCLFGNTSSGDTIKTVLLQRSERLFMAECVNE